MLVTPGFRSHFLAVFLGKRCSRKGHSCRVLFGAHVTIPTLKGQPRARGMSGWAPALPHQACGQPLPPPPSWWSGKGRTVRAERTHQASAEPHSTQTQTPGKQGLLLGAVRNPPGISEAAVGDCSEGPAQRTPSLLLHHNGEGAKTPEGFQPWDAGQAGPSGTQAGHCQEEVNPSPTTSLSQEGRGSSRRLSGTGQQLIRPRSHLIVVQAAQPPGTPSAEEVSGKHAAPGLTSPSQQLL